VDSVSALVNGAARIALPLIASVIERADEIRETSSESNATRDQYLLFHGLFREISGDYRSKFFVYR
jgi:hypothetical protein